MGLLEVVEHLPTASEKFLDLTGEQMLECHNKDHCYLLDNFEDLPEGVQQLRLMPLEARLEAAAAEIRVESPHPDHLKQLAWRYGLFPEAIEQYRQSPRAQAQMKTVQNRVNYAPLSQLRQVVCDLLPEEPSIIYFIAGFLAVFLSAALVFMSPLAAAAFVILGLSLFVIAMWKI